MASVVDMLCDEQANSAALEIKNTALRAALESALSELDKHWFVMTKSGKERKAAFLRRLRKPLGGSNGH